MKRCPLCSKIYDDTWKICLDCEETLTEHAGQGTGDVSEEKKTNKPNGVVVLAWWTIITSILGVITIQGSMAINPPASTAFYLILSPISIVAAVFLLKFKEWARIAIVAISLLIVAESIITTPYASAKMKTDMMSQAELGYKQAIESAKAKDPKYAQEDPAVVEQRYKQVKKFTESAADIIIVVLVMLAILFYLGVAYYLSLTKIRGYFS